MSCRGVYFVLPLVLVYGCGGSTPTAPVNPYADSGVSSPVQNEPVAPAEAPVAPVQPVESRPMTGRQPSARSSEASVAAASGLPTEPSTTSGSPATPERIFDVKSTGGGSALDPGENAFQVALENVESVRKESEKAGRSLGGGRSDFQKWTVQPDPMPDEYTVPAEARLAVKIPGLTRVNLNNFWEGGRIRILYPRTPSPFVGLGLNEGANEFREVWDLRSRKKLGDVKGLGLGRSKLMALSPDGKHFAAKPAFSSIVGVYDVKEEKPVQTIPLGSPWTKIIAFAGPNRLIFDDEGHLQIWSIPDFELVNAIKLPGWMEEDSWSLSPNGRYLVVVDRAGFKTQANFFDLSDGSEAGRLVLSDRAQCQGTAFSQDGKQFAALLDGTWGGGVIQVWDLESGTITVEHELDQALREQIAPHREYQGRNLEWFPAGSFLLVYGRGVYDVDGGELLLTFPEATAYEIKVLDANRLSVINKEQLVPYEMKDLFARAIKNKEAGGTPEDANRPPLTRPDRSSLAERQLPDGQLPWKVSVSPPARRNPLTSRPIDIPGGQIFVGAISTGESPQAAVMYSKSHLQYFARSMIGFEDNAVWIERFDLRSGSKKKRLDLPTVSTLEGISPSGDFVAVRLADGMNRVDVWNLDKATHFFGLRPYQERGNTAGKIVNFADLIDDSHLITTGGERLILWEIPSGKAIYEIPVGTPRPRFTPNRDYILITDQELKNLVLLNSITGEPEGSIPLVKLAAETIHSYSVSPDGRTVAAITRRPSGGELSLHDLSTGLETTAFPLPVTAEVIQWVEDGYLLLDGTSLVSLAQQAVVWNYNLNFGMHIRESADERHWYMCADSALDRSFRLLGAALPEQDVAEKVSSPMYKGRVLLQPGGKISLSVNVGGVPGEPDLGKQVIESLTRRFSAANITVSPDQPIRLVINGSSGGTGKELSNDFFGTGNALGGGEVIKISEQQVTWDIYVEHDGKRVWETSLRATNAGSYSYNRDWDASKIASAAAQQGADRMWSSAASLLKDFEPPKYAFPAGASWGAGKSSLSTRGPQP